MLNGKPNNVDNEDYCMGGLICKDSTSHTSSVDCTTSSLIKLWMKGIVYIRAEVISAPTISVFKKRFDDLWLLREYGYEHRPVPKLLFWINMNVYPINLIIICSLNKWSQLWNGKSYDFEASSSLFLRYPCSLKKVSITWVIRQRSLKMSSKGNGSDLWWLFLSHLMSWGVPSLLKINTLSQSAQFTQFLLSIYCSTIMGIRGPNNKVVPDKLQVYQVHAIENPFLQTRSQNVHLLKPHCGVT